MPVEMVPTPNATKFWTSFAGEAAALRELVLTAHARVAHARIESLLDAAAYPYIVELTSVNETAELIFTPESNPKLAVVVDEFVSFAPPLPGWTVYNRRQRRPIEDAIATVETVYDVSLADLRLSFCLDGKDCSVVFVSELADILGEPEKEGFLAFFLEHAVGEDFAMNHITQRNLIPLPGHPPLLTPAEFVQQIYEACGKG